MPTSVAGHSPVRVVPLIAFVVLAACERGTPPLFELLPPERTGITFVNTIAARDSLNVQRDVYLYNGAGTAVGDIDNDGLPDLFFAGNMVPSRLYRNKGGMQFEDITARAGINTTGRWVTGVSMVDIDGDGYLDIYVSVSGPDWSTPAQRANMLFLNNRNGTFTEAAARFGIADSGFTTHAAFLDYDGDACLDLFLLENSPTDFSRGSISAQPAGMHEGTPGSYNQLYRNDCHGAFTNVSVQAGIGRDPGYGLGVVVADFNRDGRPDIYVSNDAVPNDALYVNNGDGTFTNKAGRWLKHASVAGMGVDAADFNNDGWSDVIQADMLPRALERRKRVLGYATYGSLLDSRSRGFRDDYSANSLQLSNGVTPEGDVVFSEIGRLAGVSHTDWSWSVLFADFDNDGNKDIFIGNGYPKAVNDLDYVNAVLTARRRAGPTGSPREAWRLLDGLPSYEETSYLFRNLGDLRFADVSKAWGIEKPAFSYGAAYVDLDNDGRLDLVVNNIDAPPFVYHNVQRPDDAHHYLTVRLDGDAPNRRGIGAMLTLTAGGQKQHLYQSPYRGYMSTVDDRPHFGLGRATRVDSLEVVWGDGRRQVLTGQGVDRLLVLRQADAQAAPRTEARPLATSPSRFFQPVDPRAALAYIPPTPSLADYGVQPLLPYMVSRHGPVLAVADVNGDALDDVYVGGGNGTAGKLFLQQQDGRFVESAHGQPWAADAAYEDWGALFFDANGDGRPDLYVASGGYQLGPNAPLLQDRLYINQGGGRFTRDAQALPVMLTSTAAVRAGDFDGDGRLDLFVGGRLTPRSWPLPTRSYILHNDGGRFTDVTEQVAPELVNPGGMITDGAWVDYDGDGRLDLVTTGEWMPIQFYHNAGGRLRDVTAQQHLPPMRGWWFSLAVGDFDRDGRPDIVAGNLGLNYSYTTSKDSLFGVYAGDFTGNRTTDVVLTQTLNGVEVPIAGMSPLGRELYTLALKFPTYGSFATASMEQLFGARLQGAVHYEADTFASVVLHNDGPRGFSMTALPTAAQIAPIRGIAVHDVDGDGHFDLIVAGNLYDTEPNTPPADAGNGLWLRGDGRGHFTAVSPRESGFLAPKNATGLALVKTRTGVGILIANAGDSLQTFVIRKP
jgi:enediyne biosynthesis protein E4